jgi:hypothetical protein
VDKQRDAPESKQTQRHKQQNVEGYRNSIKNIGLGISRTRIRHQAAQSWRRDKCTLLRQDREYSYAPVEPVNLSGFARGIHHAIFAETYITSSLYAKSASTTAPFTAPSIL